MTARICPHCLTETGDQVIWGRLRVTEVPLAAYWRGDWLKLSAREIMTLNLLARGRATHAALDLVLLEDSDTKATTVRIHLMRRKLAHLPLEIQTLKGIGYRLIDTEADVQPSPVIKLAA